MSNQRLSSTWITYINLPSSTERRASIEAQFFKMAMEIRLVRTDAISVPILDSGNQGLSSRERGCLLSHKKAIQSIPSGTMGIVLEDDALFSRHFKMGLTRLTQALSSDGLWKHWDVVFLGHTPSFKSLGSMKFWLQEMRKFSQSKHSGSFRLMSGHRFVWGTFAYLVHPDARDNIVAAIDENLKQTLPSPIDNLFARLIRGNQIKGLISFPSLVGVNPKFATTISDRISSSEAVYHAIAANSLVADFNLKDFQDLIQNRPLSELTEKSFVNDERTDLIALMMREFLIHP